MDGSSRDAGDSLIVVLARVGALWVAVLLGYYALLPLLGIGAGYNDAPILIALYYLVWVAIAAYTFLDIYRVHLPSVRSLWSDILLSAGFGLVAWLFLLVFSFTTVPDGIHVIAPVTDLLLATPWYFVPKTAEILLQQVLISVVILSLHTHVKTMRGIMLLYAALFGSVHLLLLFGGEFPPAVLIMTLAAVASTAVFPHLILRVSHGFVFCYMIHWSFYAVLASILRLATGG